MICTYDPNVPGDYDRALAEAERHRPPNDGMLVAMPEGCVLLKKSDSRTALRESRPGRDSHSWCVLTLPAGPAHPKSNLQQKHCTLKKNRRRTTAPERN